MGETRDPGPEAPDPSDELALSFVGRSLPGHVHRTWEVEPGAELPFDAAAWRDALVVVEDGVLEVECGGGDVASFPKGAILFLDRLPVRRLRNPGARRAVISAVSRRTAAP